jgi:HK97 family phage portal protein
VQTAGNSIKVCTMGIIQRLLHPNKPLLEAVEKQNTALLELKARISLPNAPKYEYMPFTGNFVMAPVFQDLKKYIDEGFNINSTVYSIINTCAEKFGSIPWNFYGIKSQKKAAEYHLLSKGYSDNPLHLIKLLKLKEQSFDELGDDNDLMKLWNNPNDQITGADFRAFCLMFKMITGAATINMDRGGTGFRPQEMNVLPSQFIQLWPDPSLNKIARMTYNISGAQYPLELEDTLYWKYNNPNFTITGEHLYGQAPLRAAGIEVAADNQNVLAQKFMFEHAGVTGLWMPKTQEISESLTTPQADELRGALADIQNRNDVGTQKRPYVNIPMDYQSYGMDAKEMDLVQSRRLSKEFIANVFNFPPALLSLERATDNNFDAAVKYVVTNTIYANLCSYRDRMNNWLIKQFGYKPGQYYLDFDISSLPELQGDFQKMVESLGKMDWITFDEKREAMKYDAKGGAYDTAYIPSSSIPIELAGDMGTIPNNGIMP